MSRPDESTLENPERAESFEERVDLLFEELSFAIQWQRPSILLALFGSKYLRKMAELALERRLAKIGQRMVQFTVDEKHFDIPLLLSQHADRGSSVYSVAGLFKGGGKQSANAYRALNMRREYFVDYTIRVIIWLTRGEATELSRHAPDFWAFRHRVVEFYDSSDLDLLAISADELSGRARGFPGVEKDLDEQIKLGQATIRGLPKQAESLASRLDLLTNLAGLYQAKQAYDQSVRRLKQGILIAKQLNNGASLAKFWGNLGLIYLDLDQPTRAIRAYWKAIRLNPQDAGLWIGLEQTYLAQGRMESARSVYQKAARVMHRDENT
jgi:tetratricopeptide (TPR) repeat protein